MRGRSNDITQRRRTGLPDLYRWYAITGREQAAISRAANAVLAWEQWYADACNRKAAGLPQVPFAGPTGEALLDEVCTSMDRWDVLARASIYLAEERRGAPAGHTRNQAVRAKKGRAA